MRRRSTTERGLGGSHQTERIKALANLADGDPCFRCQLRGVYHPMYTMFVTWVMVKGRKVPRSKMLDLDDYPGRRFGGPQIKRLSYRSCNRANGAEIINARRAASRKSQYTRW